MAITAAEQDEVSSAIGMAIALDVAAADSDAEAVARGTSDLVAVGVDGDVTVADAVELDCCSSSSGDMTRSITCIKPLFVLQCC